MKVKVGILRMHLDKLDQAGTLPLAWTGGRDLGTHCGPGEWQEGIS